MVLKAEYSCSGQGVRWGWEDRAGSNTWAAKQLEVDGVLCVEPVVDIAIEFCGEDPATSSYELGSTRPLEMLLSAYALYILFLSIRKACR